MKSVQIGCNYNELHIRFTNTVGTTVAIECPHYKSDGTVFSSSMMTGDTSTGSNTIYACLIAAGLTVDDPIYIGSPFGSMEQRQWSSPADLGL